jgi:hypothetical protein
MYDVKKSTLGLCEATVMFISCLSLYCILFAMVACKVNIIFYRCFSLQIFHYGRALSFLRKSTTMKHDLFFFFWVSTHSRELRSSRIQTFQGLSHIVRKSYDGHSTRLRRGVFEGVESLTRTAWAASGYTKLGFIIDDSALNVYSAFSNSQHASMH